MKFSQIASTLLLGASGAVAIDVEWTNEQSIKTGMKTVATDMVSYYTGYRPGDVPGNLPAPYYWWEAGAMFGALIDYWYYTGDTEWNAITTQAMLHQIGPDQDYMPPNQSKSLGNDDQAFWGMAAMSAAENRYPDPPADQPGWLALAQAVFNGQTTRWDNETCGGGLKWQIYPFNNGYNYKNTISQGCFFNIAARLGRYTGNSTYTKWASKAWEWTQAAGLMSQDYHFYDGTDDKLNCTQLNHIQWTYNAGVFLYGAATMWNISAENGDEQGIWRERTEGIIKGLSVFVSNEAQNVMTEVACEPNDKCNIDQRSFKAYLSRWMASSMKVAPWTADMLQPILEASRQAAVKICNAGDNSRQCGLRWYTGTNDGSFGVGEQMSVLEVMGTALIHTVAGPLTNKTGGTSRGDPNAGAHSAKAPIIYDEVTLGDKAGAGILTAIILIGILGGAWWIIA
ncbi:glycoside hydrolase family 76 protein [Aplosporella prunicola CBS 121167]|uniref:Mannan endo-1,6-alpha-mannosidase n=1 Tax=Aplosporella prunicola CBS 121167 TaxID=1176127 RepID=A0A6A6AWK0_9PEZI|nr:glycoside hydrolase family 76 protein [Aplosporella prunicola CBS 121167]KAF2135976.1 glycoside hydrolase family 76 protein [Aplosporella prunicola CBS 121167]